MKHDEGGVALLAAPLSISGGFRVKDYTQFRDLKTGKFIRRDLARSLPRNRVVEEQRRILVPRTQAAATFAA